MGRGDAWSLWPVRGRRGRVQVSQAAVHDVSHGRLLQEAALSARVAQVTRHQRGSL